MKQKGYRPYDKYSESLEELLEELNIYHIELEHQNDELRRAQNEVVKSKNKYLDLFHNAPNGYVILNENQEILEINSTARNMLGLINSMDKKHPTLSSFVHKDSQDILYFHFQKVQEKRTRHSCEVQLKKKGQDSPVFVRMESLPINDNGKESSDFHIRMSLTDITDKKLAEEKLLESESLHRETLSNISDAVFITDVNGRFTFVCVNTINIFEKEDREVWKAGDINSLLEGDILGKVPTEDAQEVTNIDWKITTESGSTKDLLVNIKKVRIKDGRFLFTCREVTERRKAEKALLKTSTRLTNVLQSMSDGFFTLDHQLRVTDFNPAAEKILGRKKKEILGIQLFDAFPEAHESIFEKKYIQALNERKSLFFEAYFDAAPYTNWYDVRVHPHDDGIAIFFQVTTQRKLAEKALKESNERFRSLFNNSLTGIFYISPEGEIMEANKKILEMLGSPSLDETTKRINIHDFEPLKQIGYTDDFNRCLESGDIIFNETKYTSKWGSEIYARYYFNPITNNEGEIIGILANVEDVTEIKKSELQIKNYVDNLRVISEFSSELIHCTTKDETISLAADKIYELNHKKIYLVSGYYNVEKDGILIKDTYGFGEFWQQIAGMLDMDIMQVPFRTDNMSQKARDVFASGSLGFFEEGLHELTSGVFTHVQVNAIEKLLGIDRVYAMSFSLNGIPTGGILILAKAGQEIFDISTTETLIKQASIVIERLKTQVDLRAREQQFKTLFEHASDGIFIHDLNGQILEINEIACAKLGYSKEEMLQMTFREIHKSGYVEVFQDKLKMLTEDNTVFAETVQLAKDGKEIPTELNARMINFKNKTVFLSVARDITDRKRTELDLLRAKDKAEESDRLKSAFLANMSHEIRTPMNAIIGFSDLLDNSDLDSERRNKYTRIIKNRSQDLLQIVNDILDISKIEIGQMEIMEKKINVKKMLQDIYTLYQEKLGAESSVEFIFDPMDTKIEETIIADDLRLKQVLGNLIDNAIKYTKNGSIRFGTRLAKNGFLEFYVKDTGAGIPKDKWEIIFERFMQSDEQTGRIYGGTGLGLSICKSLLAMMGGKMWLDSEVGKGSTFYFQIPYHPIQANEHEHEEKEIFKKSDWTGKHVLIVEDDQFSSDFLKMVLQSTNVKISLAETGSEAIEFLTKNRNVDIVLMDVRLPDMSGIDITEKLRAKDFQMPIIAQTAYAMENDRQKCLAAGCNEYVSKPVNREKLLGLMKKYL